MKKKVKNYSFRATLCDEYVKRLSKHFKIEEKWVNERRSHFEDEWDLCKEIKRSEPYEHLPL